MAQFGKVSTRMTSCAYALMSCLLSSGLPTPPLPHLPLSSLSPFGSSLVYCHSII